MPGPFDLIATVRERVFRSPARFLSSSPRGHPEPGARIFVLCARFVVDIRSEMIEYTILWKS